MAGTSKSTVSRYLNGHPVKQPTRDALEKAIRELRYHRNANARRLVLNRTHLIGVVVDDISNIFYSGILKGVEETVKSNGYSCMFLSRTSHYDRESAYLNMLHEGQADGLILVSFRKRDPEELRLMAESGVPLALIGDDGGRPELIGIDVDNKGGIKELVGYLHSLGHERIGFIAGPESASASGARYRGYREAMEERGLPIRPEWTVPSEWTSETGYAAMRKLLNGREVSAVLASNDDTAFGALQAAQEGGLRVPEDLSIVGFDDISAAAWSFPSLTTVRQPFRQMGMLAAQRLLARLEGTQEESPVRRRIQPALVIRNSCGRPGTGQEQTHRK
ncbi:LacI family DNA-binding transcriptional regulator [Paenibacillus aurantius]|uniref:LacI family DNA-binding transcriptional regulator n=1 Tax=Paenibacillus aurantius TaxID=2918900 RepID=A0AA96RD52_9BACL|nr:LacI family DNA-binding transcriptional regulator [Paenibacillus aurantius]WNQ09041.1 LacI family DNA-binding transcriptional regulator [Paenibacillus aurantius]